MASSQSQQSQTREVINISGNILICNEACKVVYNYDVGGSLTVRNISSTLTLSPAAGNYLQYNGVDDSLKMYKFNLYGITLNYPSQHFINSYLNPQWIEVIMQHQTDDKKTQLNVSILLIPDDSKAAQNTLAYKLFDNIAKNMPDVGQSNNIPVTEWYVKDILPEDRSFYSYISPSNEFLNWIVFQNNVQVPSALLQAFKVKVAGNVKVDTTPPAANPDGLIIFGYKDHTKQQTGSTQSGTATGKCPSVSEIRKQIQSEQASTSGSTANTATNTAANTAANNTVGNAASNAAGNAAGNAGMGAESGEGSGGKVGFWQSWRGIMLIIAIVIVVFAIVLLGLYYLYFRFLSGSTEGFFATLMGSLSGLLALFKTKPMTVDDYKRIIGEATGCQMLADILSRLTADMVIPEDDKDKLKIIYDGKWNELGCEMPEQLESSNAVPSNNRNNKPNVQKLPEIKRYVRNKSLNKKMNEIANKLARQNI